MADETQIQTDVDFLVSQPGWKNPSARREYIRGVGARSLSDPDMDPDHHSQVMQSLWARSDERTAGGKAADFITKAGKEIVYGGVAAGAAVGHAIHDAASDESEDFGSSTRFKRGVVGLVDSARQRVKSLHPNDNQEKRDAVLAKLKEDLDKRAYPEGLEAWIAGEYDGGEKPDAETQEWIDALTFGLGKKAVAADSGDATNEKVGQWVESDRSPRRKDSDSGGVGPRVMLGDYLVTRDPASWDAFAARVKETDAQQKTRQLRWLKEGRLRSALERGEEGFKKEVFQRGAEMQTSPIDMAMSAFPFLRGARAFKAARSGNKAQAAWETAKAVGIEGATEGLTEALQDPNASNAQIGEASALGAVGSGMVSTTAAAVGSVLPSKTQPETATPSEPTQPEAPATVTYRTYDEHGRLKATKEATLAEATKELRGRESMLSKLLKCLTS